MGVFATRAARAFFPGPLLQLHDCTFTSQSSAEGVLGVVGESRSMATHSSGVMPPRIT